MYIFLALPYGSWKVMKLTVFLVSRRRFRVTKRKWHLHTLWASTFGKIFRSASFYYPCLVDQLEQVLRPRSFVSWKRKYAILKIIDCLKHAQLLFFLLKIYPKCVCISESFWEGYQRYSRNEFRRLKPRDLNTELLIFCWLKFKSRYFCRQNIGQL